MVQGQTDDNLKEELEGEMRVGTQNRAEVNQTADHYPDRHIMCNPLGIS